MVVLVTIALSLGLIVWFFVRPHQSVTVLSHPTSCSGYFFFDLFNFFHKKMYNLYSKVGIIYAYCGAFGKGKTLSMVHDARHIYKRYNGRKVWFKGEWRTQYVKIYSNVAFFDIPFNRLNTLMDLVDVSDQQPKYDDEHHIHTINLFIIDELSSLLNSRNFATNLNFDVIASLLQCRKANARLMYTAQNFTEVDALLRRNTHFVCQCDKRWRFMFGLVYDAKELEYALNPLLVKPCSDYGWFVFNKDFSAYDTYSQAMKVDKNAISSDFISTQEAYQRLLPPSGTLDNVDHLTGKGSRRQRKSIL